MAPISMSSVMTSRSKPSSRRALQTTAEEAARTGRAPGFHGGDEEVCDEDGGDVRGDGVAEGGASRRRGVVGGRGVGTEARRANPRRCRRGPASVWRTPRRPRAWRAVMKAAAAVATALGSVPNARSPMTVLAGFVWTSTTGAGSMSTWHARSSRPMMSPATRRRARGIAGASDALGGGDVRVVRSAESRDAAALLIDHHQKGTRRRATTVSAHSVATCAGSRMFRAKMITRPRARVDETARVVVHLRAVETEAHQPSGGSPSLDDVHRAPSPKEGGSEMRARGSGPRAAPSAPTRLTTRGCLARGVLRFPPGLVGTENAVRCPFELHTAARRARWTSTAPRRRPAISTPRRSSRILQVASRCRRLWCVPALQRPPGRRPSRRFRV